MGTLISLDHFRANGPVPRHHRVAFWFDLADPATYLAAERVERLLPGIGWRPATLPAQPGQSPQPGWSGEDAATRRAAELGLPLVWPRSWPAPVPRAMRAAAYADECGRGDRFVLAASRLAFCGGFDLDDPETLAEAAAAAGIGLRECLRAAADADRDADMLEAGRSLLVAGGLRLPVVRAGGVLFDGEQRIGDAASALRVKSA